MSHFTLAVLLLLAVVYQQAHALSDTNCIQLHHHTFSWQIEPQLQKVSFKAMFMPPFKENDLVIHVNNRTALLFRVNQEHKSLEEWRYNDGNYERIGSKYLTRKMIMPMSEPMKMLHVEFTRVWGHGFDPSVDDDPVEFEMRLYDDASLSAKPKEVYSRQIQWYHGVNECGDGDGHTMGMPMAFYWSWEVMMFFKGWMPMNFKEFVPAWIFTFSISFVLQIFLWIFSHRISNKDSKVQTLGWIVKGTAKVIVTILSIAQMLLMMTYNVPLLIGIVLGNLIGWSVAFGFLNTLLRRLIIRFKLLKFDEEKEPLIVNEEETANAECCS